MLKVINTVVKYFKPILFGFFLFCFSPLASFSLTSPSQVSPIGAWQTIDDITKQPRSVMLLSIDSQGILSGKITKINYRPGEGENDVCLKCTGPLYHQKILGLTILTGMKQSQSNPLVWEGGHIVDPESGKSYSCRISLAPNGKDLTIRGYILFSFIGRNQIWHRI